MKTDRSYTQKLSILYANYFDAWRALFGEPVSGSLDAPARKPLMLRMTDKQTVTVCILAMLVLMALGGMSPARGQAASPGFNDAVIGQMVRTAINNDCALRTMDIIIDVQERVVRLSGFVNTAVRNAIRLTHRPSRA